MAPNTLWNGFRKFRLIVLALASVLSLIWSIIITVYMAKNWSSYDSAQRAVFFGLIAVDLIGSILLYLMVVVQYRFWPDAARTAVLLGLHVAGSAVFTMRSSSFPCSAFGSTANCHIMTMIVIIGSWVISGLLAMYAICLPVIAFIPRPPSANQTDVEKRPDIAEEDTRESRMASASLAHLLKNPEEMSPEVHTSELPIPPEMPAARATDSNASSLSSLHNQMEVEAATTASFYPDPSETSFTDTIRAPDNVDRSLNSSGSSSSGRYPHRSNSNQLFPLPNRFLASHLDVNRASVASGTYESSYDSPAATPIIAEVARRSQSMNTGSSPSVYSQSTARAESTSASQREYRSASTDASKQSTSLAAALAPEDPGRVSVYSMMASVHNHWEPQSSRANYDTTNDGFLSPPLTALPSPRFLEEPSQTSFELHLSDSPKSEDKADLPTLRPPVRPHVRTDSTSSVDLNEWKKLVLTAAGRDQ